MLAIVHVSSRYNVSAVLDEARDVFPNTIAPRDFDLVEIPFPERGEPGADPGRARAAARAPGRAGAHRRVGNRRAVRLRLHRGLNALLRWRGKPL